VRTTLREGLPSAPVDLAKSFSGATTVAFEAINGHATELAAKTAPSLVLIEPRSFLRNCMASSLSTATGMAATGVASVEDYLAHFGAVQPSIVVICAMDATASVVSGHLIRLKAAGVDAPVIVMADASNVDLIHAALNCDANGFIPADISLEVAAHAMRLVMAGGKYFPVNTLVASRRPVALPAPSLPAPKTSLFTRRQIAVIDALRKGKANKIIAYELNMCESTVKVHVRNIMKKLNAKNRTEVAYLAGELLAAQGDR
jgi:DNA-binding NarL/FixJ family response regulator